MKFNIPSRFTLGGVEYKVEYDKNMASDGKYGEWDSDGLITLATQRRGNELNESLKRQNFFHELTHAILYQMGRNDLSGDEGFVQTFSSFLSGTIDTMEL